MKTNSINEAIIKGSSWSFVSKVVQVIAKTIIVIFLARLLGPESFGVFMLFIAISMIMTAFIDLGISPASARLLAEDYYDKKSVVQKSTLLLTVILLTSCTLFAYALPLISSWFSSDGLIVQRNLFFLLFFALIIQKYSIKLFEGLRQVKIYGQINLLTGWFPWLFSLISILVFQKSAYFASIGYVIGYFFFGIILLVKLLMVLSQIDKTKKPSVKYSIILRYAAPMMVTTASLYVYTQSDILLIQYFLGNEEVGIYSAAVKVVEASLVGAMALGNGVSSYFPLVKKSGQNAYKNILFQSTKVIKIIYLPAVAAIIISYNDVMVFLFGNSYQAAGLILLLYCPYLILRAISCVYSLALDYLGYADQRAIAVGISAIGNIILNISLIPVWGIAGAAVATQITYVPLVVLYIYILLKDASIKPAEYIIQFKTLFLIWLIPLFFFFVISVLLNINNLILASIYGLVYVSLLLRYNAIDFTGMYKYE